MDQLLTPEFWKSEVAFVMGAPWIILPLLIIAWFHGWWFRGREDRGEIRGLNAQLQARDEYLRVRDERLQLAHDSERDARQKWALAETEGQSLRDQVRLYASKDAALATIESSVVRTVRAIEQANTSSIALGRTLTFPTGTWITQSSDEPKSNDPLKVKIK